MTPDMHMTCLPLVAAAALAIAAFTPVLAAPDQTVQALRVTPDGLTDFMFRVTETPDLRRWLTIDCVRGCSTTVHVRKPVADPPRGFLALDNGLVYSLWETGCCYVARVWRVTPTAAEMIFEQGSRGPPSVRTHPNLSIETYMRPTDVRGRETSMTPAPITWAYRDGRFIRVPTSRTADGW